MGTRQNRAFHPRRELRLLHWQGLRQDGIVVWETQETDYPPTPPGVPNEPRGCPRGASYSWYLYSASRVKHPLIRAELKAAWEEARKTMKPMEAWASIVENPEVRKSYTAARGLGGAVPVRLGMKLLK